jgi:hypothetical protein
MDNSRPDTAEKTARKQSSYWGNQKELLLFYSTPERSLPEMAGVSTPSPITIQVPRRTRTSKAVCKVLHFSSTTFNQELFSFSGGCSNLYVETASSAS